MPFIQVTNNSLALTIAKRRWLRRLNIFALPNMGVVSWKSWPFYIYLKDWTGPSFHILNSGVDSYENESYRVLSKIVKTGSVFFDIGANVGIFSFRIARDIPGASIFAFEPEPHAHQCLKKTAEANSVTSVTLLNHAISDSDGMATFYFDGINHGGHSLDSMAIIRDGSIISDKFEVLRMSLDSFIEKHNVAKVDVVKLDVQRHEESVLRGARNLIQTHRPVFLIECFVDELTKTPSPLVQPFIEAGGYFMFDPISEQTIALDNYSAILKSAHGHHYRDLFFIPQEKAHLLPTKNLQAK